MKDATPEELALEAERLDHRTLLAYVRAQRRAWPAGGAALRIEPAGIAAVDGAGRDTRLVAHGPAGDALDALLAWHAQARAATADPSRHPRCRLVLPPRPTPELVDALAARGFAYRSHALVLARPLDAPLPAPDPALDVREAGPEQRAIAARTIARGYLDGAPPGPLDLRAAETWFDLPGAAHLIARRGGRPIGGGAVVIDGTCALLGQMSVLPEHRGRGVQRALVAHRLRHARSLGATRAFATSAPSGASLRNLRRAGFAIMHVRVALSGPPTVG